MATHTDHGHHTPNVHPAEQLASLFLGACLVRHGLKSDHPGHAGGLLSMAAGGLLIHRGLQGRCMLYERLGIDTRGEQKVNGRNTSEIHASVTIDRPAAELYREWRDLEHLSRILSHVHSIREIDDTTSRWIIDGPAGESIGFVSRITQDIPDRRIAWSTTEEADFQNAGMVEFIPDTETGDGRNRTEVAVTLRYEVPAGLLGRIGQWLMPRHPKRQLMDDLRRFRRRMEENGSATGGAAAGSSGGFGTEVGGGAPGTTGSGTTGSGTTGSGTAQASAPFTPGKQPGGNGKSTGPGQ